MNPPAGETDLAQLGEQAGLADARFAVEQEQGRARIEVAYQVLHQPRAVLGQEKIVIHDSSIVIVEAF